MKKTTINANGTEIKVFGDIINEEAYLCITDIAKRKNPEDANGVIANWLRSRSTIEFLGYGNSFIIWILNPSNSRGLKMRQVEIHLQCHLRSGLKIPMLLA